MLNVFNMETKEQLIGNIKEWIKMDTEINKLKAELREKNIKKKQITENLMSVMKTNNIDCFDIHGGALIYKKSKLKKPINQKTLLSCLQQYYKENKQGAEDVAKYIMDNREEQVKETIRRKIEK